MEEDVEAFRIEWVGSFFLDAGKRRSQGVMNYRYRRFIRLWFLILMLAMGYLCMQLSALRI